MLNFLICSIVFFLYAFINFKRSRIIYPSTVFSVMWGAACFMIYMVLKGAFDYLYLEDYYDFKFMEDYIVFFTIASLIGFTLAHTVFSGNKVNIHFNFPDIELMTRKLYWIMWLNFFGGILRIIIMLTTVGFQNVIDYRVAANSAMMGGAVGTVDVVFKITAYIQLLANCYVALYGIKDGFSHINAKKLIALFILYSPTQLATGGRLFILYFVIFYFCPFLLGRGLRIKDERGKFFSKKEKKIVAFFLAGLLVLVPIIAMSRVGETKVVPYDDGKRSESFFAKFTYITEGIVESEHYMQFNPPDKMKPDNGSHFLTGKSDSYRKYKKYLLTTKMGSIVVSVISSLYTSFGYWGSIFMWGVMAFVLEVISIVMLRRLTIMRFLILIVVLKMMYETVIANPISANIPMFELLILIALFYKPLINTLKSY